MGIEVRYIRVLNMVRGLDLGYVMWRSVNIFRRLDCGFGDVLSRNGKKYR